MKIAFWNTNKNIKINDLLCRIIDEKKIDIFVLAEYNDDCERLIQNLENNGIIMEQYFSPGCERITILGRIQNVMPGNQNKYYSIQIINDKFIICGLHLPSKISSDYRGRQNVLIDAIIKDLNELENNLSIEDTIIVGDLNVNPYEEGCLEASKFHGIPICEDAQKGARVVMGQKFKMFYNPMWNFFGDFKFPPGTYYYNGSNSVNSYWNIFDQVMIRPQLRDRFITDSLEIITDIREISLIDGNKHPNKTISDHLPIVFEIEEELK
ncbi:hypothetical protein [Hungatella hathewayi]|uniref:hypothetical protein n=1 Tax=Hungatella hathewayi TaxID=154046 RepID=UPI00039CB8F1|nr:hypothetical protein [Hungatella hathewayi]